ncbi:MAG: hypothetical protein LW817_03695, partial [Candidatus Caenarcaniphilales bacterium]|nr:hypothetical protein [Candidatus Caenarcaniphilales bacterium]
MNKTNTKLLQITALGGLHEYGKNMYLFEAINPDSRKALIVDAGIIFPGLEYPGVDYKLADYKYALSNKIAIEALVLTNMHEAHSGGAHHVINKCNIKKVIGSKLALQLVKAKLGEAQVKSIEWINFESRQELIVDDFKITPFTFATCTHESYAVLIEAYGSKVFYTSSFKIDQT